MSDGTAAETSKSAAEDWHDRRDNSDHPTGWRFWVYAFFGNWRWCRRWMGGIWELWWVDPCRDVLWYRVDSPSDRTQHPHIPCSLHRYPMDREDWR